MKRVLNVARRSRASGHTNRALAPIGRRGVLCCALLLAVGLGPRSAAGQDSADTTKQTTESLGYQGVDPGSEQKFDIASGRVLTVLPFDVQFFIQSRVSPDVTMVFGRYLQERELLAKGRSCADLFPDTEWQARGYLAPLVLVNRGGKRIAIAGPPVERPAARPVDRPPDEIKGQKDIAFIRFFENEMGEGEAKKKVRSVELSVPALAPNRDICFEFTVVEKVDQAAFRKLARTAVERELQSTLWVEPTTTRRTGEITRSTIGTPAAFNRLRRRLIGEILTQRGRGERLEAPAGSFFDPHVNLAGVEADYQERFVKLMGKQTNRFRQIESIQGTNKRIGTRGDLVESLRKLVKSPAYKKLADRGGYAKTVLGDSLVPGLRPDATAIDCGKWADGLVDAAGATAGVARDLEDVWSPRELADTRAGDVVTPGILSNLERGQRSFDRFLAVLQSYVDDPNLGTLDGLDAAATGQLREAVGEVADQLDLHLEGLRELQRLLVERDRKITALLDELALELDSRVRLLGTTTGGYETRASYYISADIGVGYAPDVEEMFTYIGTNIYFRPVNKKAPLRGLSFKKRFSIMLGLTNESLESEGQLKGIVGTSPLLVAGGLRLNDFIRLSAGAVIFKDEDPNPLITEEQLAWSPYISISIDWNLRKIFARFGGAFLKE